MAGSPLSATNGAGSGSGSGGGGAAGAAAGALLHDYLTYVDPPHFLKCPICTDVMKSPVSLSCGHSFCAGCCQRTLERKKECPCCRAEVLHAPHPNIALCQALDEQHVFCRFGPRTGEFPAGQPVFELDPSQGCAQQVKRSHLQTHEKECPHRWVPCGLLDTCTDERCRVLCRARELAQHQKQCKFRLVPCSNEGCDEQVSLRSLEKHKQHCLFEMVQCPNKGCAEQRLCKAMPQHAAQCPFRVVTCMFANIGCGEKGNVAAMDDHMRVAVNEHLMLMAQALASAQQKVLSERRVLCPKKRFKCVVHDFDRLAKKTVIDIDLDLSWKLKIWPNGEDKRHRGYVSIRLFSREAAAEFRVEGPYTLRIVNQLDASKSIVKITEASSREWADSVRGWGFPAFAKVDDVVNPAVGFLKDGKLVVDVEVVVQSVVEIVEYSEPE